MILLHRLLQARRLLLKRLRTSRIARVAKEALWSAVAYRRRSRGPPAGRQAGASWNHRQVPGHHARGPQLTLGSRDRGSPARSKALRTHRRYRPGYALIVDARQVGISQPVMQRRDAAIVVDGYAVDIVDVSDVGDVDRIEPVAKATPPGEEAIAWADGQPAESTPAAEAHSKAKAATPSKERDVSRRPQRTVEAAAPYRSRPPGP